MRIGMIGLGKLGLPCALAMELKGHTVIGIDPSPLTQEILETKQLAYREQDAQPLLAQSRIRLVGRPELVRTSDLIFVAVQTPHAPQYEGITPIPDTRADFDYTNLCMAVQDLCRELVAQDLERDVVIISTVLPGTLAEYVRPIIAEYGLTGRLRLAYNPFFIAMGTTIPDFLNPEFSLLGVDDPSTADKVAAFYETIHDKPVVRMTVEDAELTKVLYNTFIGMKIAFANTVMELCHKTPNTDCDTIIDALGRAEIRLISGKYLRGGMGDGGGCLPAGELVMTEYGPRPIESITVGDRVLSRDGRLKPVVKVWEREYRGELLTLRAEGMPPAKFTADHGMYAAEDGRKTYVTGGKMKRVSTVAVAEKLGELVEVKAGELAPGSFLPQPRPVGDQVVVPDHVTPEYCDIAGWYLAEGSLELTSRRGRVTFDLHADEESVGQMLLALCARVAPQPEVGRGAGDGGGISVDGNSCQARYGSKQLAQQLRDDFGRGAATKQVPAWVVYGPDWVARRIMPGLWQGDGCSSGGINLSSTSANIAYAGLLLLARFGVTATLRDIPPRVGADGVQHARAYEVRVRNSRDFASVRDLTGREPPIRDEHKAYTRYPERDGICYRKLTRITRELFRGNVYNLWVDGEDHTFTTNVGWVSNCHPRDNIALSWLADQKDLSHDLFFDIMACREDQTRWLAELIESHCGDLPVVLLGQAFKPNTNITTGSPARLLSHYLRTRNIEHVIHDPHVTPGSAPTNTALYFVATQHEDWKAFSFPADSVVLDPFRYLQDNPSLAMCKYIPIGANHAVRRLDPVTSPSGPPPQND